MLRITKDKHKEVTTIPPPPAPAKAPFEPQLLAAIRAVADKQDAPYRALQEAMIAYNTTMKQLIAQLSAEKPTAPVVNRAAEEQGKATIAAMQKIAIQLEAHFNKIPKPAAAVPAAEKKAVAWHFDVHRDSSGQITTITANPKTP